MKSEKFRDPVYRANHRKLHKQRGKASDHLCVRCDNPAKQWAQVHGEDGSNPWADYVPMCCRCHVNYDRGGIPGHPQSEESRRKTSEGKRGQRWSPEAKLRMSEEWHSKRQLGIRDDQGRWTQAGVTPLASN